MVLGARFAAVVGAMPLLSASTATTEEEDGDADEEDGGRGHHDDDPGVDIMHSADDTFPDLLSSQRIGLGVENTLELPPEANAETERLSEAHAVKDGQLLRSQYFMVVW